MYEIISEGRIVALCEKPRYIKIKPESGCFVESSKEDAQGIAAGGVAYNLSGKSDIPGAPEAYARERDIAEFVFQNDVKVRENEQETNAAIIEIESALCEQDAAADERMATIEDALCDLDKQTGV